MGHYKIQRLVSAIGSATTADFLFGANGGIVTSINLTWVARDYYNSGTDQQTIKICDIHVSIADSATSATILDPTAPLALNPIIVRTASSWGWDHPKRNEILAATDVISKLAYRSFTPMPLGVVTGQLRIIAQPDPLITGVSPSLMVEAEMVTFDQNIT